MTFLTRPCPSGRESLTGRSCADRPFFFCAISPCGRRWAGPNRPCSYRRSRRLRASCRLKVPNPCRLPVFAWTSIPLLNCLDGGPRAARRAAGRCKAAIPEYRRRETRQNQIAAIGGRGPTDCRTATRAILAPAPAAAKSPPRKRRAQWERSPPEVGRGCGSALQPLRVAPPLPPPAGAPLPPPAGAVPLLPPPAPPFEVPAMIRPPMRKPCARVRPSAAGIRKRRAATGPTGAGYTRRRFVTGQFRGIATAWIAACDPLRGIRVGLYPRLAPVDGAACDCRVA